MIHYSLAVQHPLNQVHSFNDRTVALKRRVIYFILLLAVSWVVMTVTHEVGHIIGGMASGATLTNYDLVPWRMPYSLHAPDPHPLVTLWAGPLLGVAIPTLLALVVRTRWAWFIADFCLIANGAYLALASLAGDRFLDTQRLLEAGANPAAIGLYCLATLWIGYTRFRTDCVHVLSTRKETPNRVDP